MLLIPSSIITCLSIGTDTGTCAGLNRRDIVENYTFTVEGPGGFTNTIEVEPGRIRVREAGCPDQVCVNQGYISDGTVPIVCLPNKLVIEITGGGDSLDAATG